MKTRLLLLPQLLIVTFLLLSDAFGQKVIPKSTQEQIPQAEADSVALQPFPASEITEEFDKSRSLLSTALKQQLSLEKRAGYSSELDTLLSTINDFLGDSTITSLVGASNRELNQHTLRAQFYMNQIESLQGRLSRVANGLES